MGDPQEFPWFFLSSLFPVQKCRGAKPVFLGKKKLIFISDSSAGFLKSRDGGLVLQQHWIYVCCSWKKPLGSCDSPFSTEAPRSGQAGERVDAFGEKSLFFFHGMLVTKRHLVFWLFWGVEKTWRSFVLVENPLVKQKKTGDASSTSLGRVNPCFTNDVSTITAFSCYL